jgi:hypothetical protein
LALRYFFDDGALPRHRQDFNVPIFSSRSRKHSFQLSGNAATRKARRTEGSSHLRTLPAHAHQRSIGFIALILHRLLRRCAKRPFVRILRQLAIAPNHLFTIHDPN